jgi:hypothetical protein
MAGVDDAFNGPALCAETVKNQSSNLPADDVAERADLLVAPVARAGATEWSIYLPSGETWRHVWTDVIYQGGQSVTVAARLGFPPIFSRAGSTHAALFEGLRDF